MATSARPQRPIPTQTLTPDGQALYQFFQAKQHRIFKSDPTLGAMAEGEIILQDDEAAKRRIYAKINGVIWYWNADGNL